MNRHHVWGSLSSPSSPYGRWPADARDSRTWLAPDGSEAQLLAFEAHVKREGLRTLGGYATPEQQKRGQKKRNAVWKLPAWAVGVRLVVGDCSPEGSAGWWWTSGKGLVEKLRGVPAGRHRVQTAAAVVVAVQMAWSQNDLVDPIPAAWPIVRAARWPR